MIDLREESIREKEKLRKAEERSKRDDRPPVRQNSPMRKRNKEKRILAQHSSASREHYGPSDVLESVRWLMKGIDFDPCSNFLANTVVKADQYIGIPHDGLAVPWKGNIYCNPPGGDTAIVRPELKKLTRSYPCIWWGKLVYEWNMCNATMGCFMIFQLNLLQAVQKFSGHGGSTFFDFPTVFFRERLRFLYPLDTKDGLPIEGTELVEGTGPPGGSALCFVPPKVDSIKENDFWVERFYDAFHQYGRIINGPM